MLLFGCGVRHRHVERAPSDTDAEQDNTERTSISAADGAKVWAEDGLFAVTIPAGAFNDDVTIVLDPQTAPDAAAGLSGLYKVWYEPASGDFADGPQLLLQFVLDEGLLLTTVRGSPVVRGRATDEVPFAALASVWDSTDDSLKAQSSTFGSFVAEDSCVCNASAECDADCLCDADCSAPCSENFSPCFDGTCIVRSEFCDGVVDCLDASDEGDTCTAGADGYEPDNTFDVASSIDLNTTQDRSLHALGDQDIVRFMLAGSSGVRVETAGDLGDTVLTLYDATSGILMQNDDGEELGRFSRLDANLTAGSYYVRVNEYGNNALIAAYTLSLVER